jgi:hypothetical protein
MNTLENTIRHVILLSLGVTLLAAHRAFGQLEETTNINLQWVQIPRVPEGGTFWSWQLQSNFPPSPIDPWPDLPLYELQIPDSTNVLGQFLYDDRTIVYSNFFPETEHKPTRNIGHGAAGAKDVPAPGGGGGGGGSADTWDGVTNHPNYAVNSATAYNLYTNFWLAISNDSTNAYVTLESTLSNLTYEIFTNDDLTQTNAWGLWQTILATNNVMPAPPLALGTNQLFFEGLLVSSTTTNALADWWCMQYFGTLNVDPYADPDGDGLCNLSEFTLGTNPTNANSRSSIHNDAQALFLGYTNDPASAYPFSIANGTGSTLILTVSNTWIGSNYQIYTKTSSGPWIVATNFVGTNNPTIVALTTNGVPLSLIVGDGADPDGDGLPSGYEVLATHTDPLLPDTGLTGTPDGYKNPDGDAYVNLEEMYNGTDPLTFNTPPPPTGFTVVINSDGTTTVTWNASVGSSGYTLERDTGSGFVPIASNISSTSYHDTSLSFGQNARYEVQALSSAGNSGFTVPDPNLYRPQYDLPMAIVNGRSNRLFLVVSTPPPGVTNFLITRVVSANYYPFNYLRWEQPYQVLGALTTNGTFSIPVSSLSNGIAQIPDTDAPLFGSYDFTVTPAGANGTYGDAVDCWGPNVGLSQWPDYLNTPGLIPFIDGTAQLKQNLSFLLRAGNELAEFNYTLTNLYGQYYDNSTNYVYASYYDQWEGLDQFMPFEDNYGYRNFVFLPSYTNYGFPSTGIVDPVPDAFTILGNLGISYNMMFTFPTYSYVVSSNLSAVPLKLSDTPSQWVFDPFDDASTVYSGSPTPGVYDNGSGMACMTNGAPNCYGLPFTSLQWQTYANPAEFTLLTPGGCAEETYGYVYTGVQSPVLHTVGYYFARYGQFDTDGHYEPGLGTDAIPGNRDWAYPTPVFALTNTTPLMIMSVGGQQMITGYEKQAVTNAFTNVFGYLGQYFTNAFVVSNGVVTTNSGGILSEYGDFFATVPGQIALMTMPDPDQGNMQSNCVVDVIRLSLDVNHDGVMNENFTGPDNTSAQNPYVFWANNDFDRYHSGTEDDLQTAAQPDCNYAVNGYRCIPCPRDLEDYARLWVSGVSNTLSRLPSGSTVTLSWGDVGAPNTNNPIIDIFQAADADGGMGYLTNLTTASNQINTNLCQYVGRLGPGGSVRLNASAFSDSWAGDHYVWCGVLSGSGQLVLTLADGSGNTLAESSQYIQIQDIKQMYERWTVGDNDDKNPLITVNPMSNAVRAADNFSPGYPHQRFQYSYNSAYDTNDPYIVYVHGWNIPSWEKDRWAETTYKRLYWQGYQGRLGSFRWPTGDGFNSIISVLTDANNYNNSEWIAWKSGQPLENFLADLNSQYPGKVYLLAHSMGNVVTGEALRLAGSSVLVNTYVASQAAISARAYDNTVPADATNSYTPHVYGPDVEGHYYTNGAPPYFNGIGGAATFVDYFNAVDYALGYWIIDQNFKADSFNYHYTTPSFAIPSGYYYEPPFTLPRALTFPTDTYETFAEAVQSYSLALGAETNIAAKFPVSKAVNLNAAPYNFGPLHVGHSLQFRSDNMTAAPYWNQLLVSFGLSNP